MAIFRFAKLLFSTKNSRIQSYTPSPFVSANLVMVEKSYQSTFVLPQAIPVLPGSAA
jgi:hypothetical protein